MSFCPPKHPGSNVKTDVGLPDICHRFTQTYSLLDNNLMLSNHSTLRISYTDFACVSHCFTLSIIPSTNLHACPNPLPQRLTQKMLTSLPSRKISCSNPLIKLNFKDWVTSGAMTVIQTAIIIHRLF
jgi:hypothetical protein